MCLAAAQTGDAPRLRQSAVDQAALLFESLANGHTDGPGVLRRVRLGSPPRLCPIQAARPISGRPLFSPKPESRGPRARSPDSGSSRHTRRAVRSASPPRPLSVFDPVTFARAAAHVGESPVPYHDRIAAGRAGRAVAVAHTSNESGSSGPALPAFLRDQEQRHQLRALLGLLLGALLHQRRPQRQGEARSKQ